MSSNDRMSMGEIRKSRIYYKKAANGTDVSIEVEIENSNNWYYCLGFRNRKEWFKYVREINKLNKKFKKIPNIEVGEE